MHKYEEFYEAQTYDKRHLPSKESIYSRSEAIYTSYNYLKLSSEYNLPRDVVDLIKSSNCYGIISEIKTIWISNDKLNLFNYSNCTLTEIIFTSQVEDLIFFEPKKNFFNEKIQKAFLIITEKQCIFYGIDSETNEIVETGIMAYLDSKVNCVSIKKGKIFLGCQDGNIYELVYSTSNFLGIRAIYLKNLEKSFLLYFIPKFLKIKKLEILKMDYLNNWIVALTETEIKVYNLFNNEIKNFSNEIFLDIKILEENKNEIFFYAISKTGKRVFYNKHGILFDRKEPLEEKDLSPMYHQGNLNGLILYKNNGLAYFIRLNEDVIKNFSSTKPIENYELIKSDSFDKIILQENCICIIKNRNVTFYDIADSETLLENSRPEEIFNLLNNYGEREIYSMYYSLLSKEKDVTRLELFLRGNENVKNLGFFSFLFRNVKEVFNCSIDSNFFLNSERIIKKIKKVLISTGKNVIFCEDFFQCINFLKICFEYNLEMDFKLEDIFLDEEIKIKMLKRLLNQFSGKLDTLENLLIIKCPNFLNFQEIYFYKGLEILQKNKTKENLFDSLWNFEKINHFTNSESKLFVPVENQSTFSILDNLKFLHSGLEGIIDKYIEYKFYVGSVTLIRKLKCSLEIKINYLRQSLKCKNSIEKAISDISEDFNFAVFEALLCNLIENDNLNYENCLCCSSNLEFTFKEFLTLNSPFLESFLKEKFDLSILEREFDLIWKFYVVKEKLEKATQFLIKIAEKKPISLKRRIEYLSLANTLTPSQELQIKVKTAKIQNEYSQIKKSCLLENKLLTAVELFNDYLIPDNQNFLAIKLYDLFNYSDTKVLQSLFKKLLSNDLKNNLKVLNSLKLKGSALDLELITKILLKIILEKDLKINLIEELSFIFLKEDLIYFFEKMLKGSEFNHPNEKRKVREILLQVKDEMYVEKIARYCESVYGIK